jgi:hypothetical protein
VGAGGEGFWGEGGLGNCWKFAAKNEFKKNTSLTSRDNDGTSVQLRDLFFINLEAR